MRIIPSKWIKDLPMLNLLNYGIRYQKNKVRKIFYSRSLFSEPDFGLQTSNEFNPARDGCYDAHILKYFGT